MARPIPHPGGSPDLKALHDWAVKLTQGLKERFAPQDTIPEAAAPEATVEVIAGLTMIWPKVAAIPAGWVRDATVPLRADYPDLFSLIGTTYNTGGESGLNFRVPNIGAILSVPAGCCWIIKG